jgi:very-short-patch-repair endonuclease
LRRALALYRDDEFTRSELENAFLALCDAHGLPRPLVNHIVEAKEADFFWPDQRVIVETDGRATHFTIAAYEDDRARDAYLLSLGYRVVRFTELQVRLDGATVAQRLAAVLATSASR